MIPLAARIMRWIFGRIYMTSLQRPGIICIPSNRAEFCSEGIQIIHTRSHDTSRCDALNYGISPIWLDVADEESKCTPRDHRRSHWLNVTPHDHPRSHCLNVTPHDHPRSHWLNVTDKSFRALSVGANGIQILYRTKLR